MSRSSSTAQLTDDQRRLIREIEVLQRCERRTGLLAKLVIDQLIADSDRQLPDVLPERPKWVQFAWPSGEMLDYKDYWDRVDGLISRHR